MVQDQKVESQANTQDYEVFGYGIWRRYLNNGQIVEIKTEGNMARVAMDEWVRVIKDSVDRWPAGKTMYFLSDTSHPNQGMTPYARAKTKEVFEYVPSNQEVHVAAVMPKTIFFRIMTLFV